MNLSEMDLSGLVILWQASGGNLPIKAAIEKEFQNRIATNTRFSVEFFFDMCRMKGHAIDVTFIPTSDAYEKYGPDITIDTIYTEDEIAKILENYSATPPVNSQGIIRAKILVADGLTPEQIALSATDGFHTRDVLSILHG